MGTSSDHGGGVGGNWTGAKRASSSFARNGGDRNAQRALGRLVQALGGAAAVAAGSSAAAAGAERLGALLGAASAEGLDSALDQAGLPDLVGGSAEDVVAALIDSLAGSGDDREAQAARAAACDVFEELAEDADSYEDLAASLSGLEQIDDVMERFLSAYIYWLLLPVIDERLERREDPELRARRDKELREVVAAVVEQKVSDESFKPASWPRVTEAEAQQLLRDVLAYLEEQDF